MESFGNCLEVMDELQRAYLRLGDTKSKRAVAVQTEGLESEINRAIEKAEVIVRDMLKISTAVEVGEAGVCLAKTVI